MNPAPDQPPVPRVPSSPIGGTPTPPIPAPPPANPAATGTFQGTTNQAPPAIPTPPRSSVITTAPPPSPPHKFPFMAVTFFLVVTLAGIAGSFVFFSYSATKKPTTSPKILITPPVTIEPTKVVDANPFVTSSSNLTVNPFASPTTVVNPFGTYQNPFSGATVSATPATYQNPFE